MALKGPKILSHIILSNIGLHSSPYDSVRVHICTKIHNSTQHESLCSSGFVRTDVCGLHTLLSAWQEFSRRD